MRLRMQFTILLSVINGSGFSDYSDFNLTRIGHFVLYSLGNVGTQIYDLLVINFISANNYAQLAAGLNGIGLGYSRIAHCYVLQVI